MRAPRGPISPALPLLLAGAWIGGPAGAQELPPELVTAPATPAPLVDEEGRQVVGVTLSGAISLGSYQAGQAYGLARALLTQNHRLADEQGVEQSLVITGASAGTINSLLLTLTLANGVDLAVPHRSPFFRTWIPIGINGSDASLDAWRQLPEGAADPDLLLSKAAFSGLIGGIDGLFREEGRGLEHSWRGDIRYGFQLSRLTPGVEEGRPGNLVNPSIIVSEAFAFQATPQAGGEAWTPLRLGCPGGGDCPSSVRTLSSSGASAGRRLVTELSSYSVLFPIAFRVGSIGCDEIYKPLAFYPDRRCVADGDQPSMLVWDGGLYENNPVRLTHELMRDRVDPLRASTPNVYFVDPSVTRDLWYTGDVLDMPRQPANLRQEAGQLGAVIGSTFRLQGLAYFMMDHEAPQRPDVPNHGAIELYTLTQATQPFSQEFFRFLGFYDRSFRVWDFYAGLYDFHVDPHIGRSLRPRPGRVEMAELAGVDPVYRAISGALDEARLSCALAPQARRKGAEAFLQACVAQVAEETGDPERGKLWRSCAAGVKDSSLVPAPDLGQLDDEAARKKVVAAVACTARAHLGRFAATPELDAALTEVIALSALGDPSAWGGWGAMEDGAPPAPALLRENLLSLTFVNLLRQAEVTPEGVAREWTSTNRALASRHKRDVQGDDNLQTLMRILSADQEPLQRIGGRLDGHFPFHAMDLWASDLRAGEVMLRRSLRDHFVNHTAMLLHRLATMPGFSGDPGKDDSLLRRTVTTVLDAPAWQVRLLMPGITASADRYAATALGAGLARYYNLGPSGRYALVTEGGLRGHQLFQDAGFSAYLAPIGVSYRSPFPAAAWGPLGRASRFTANLAPFATTMWVPGRLPEGFGEQECLHRSCRPPRFGLMGDIAALGVLGVRAEVLSPWSTAGMVRGEEGNPAWGISYGVLLNMPGHPDRSRR